MPEKTRKVVKVREILTKEMMKKRFKISPVEMSIVTTVIDFRPSNPFLFPKTLVLFCCIESFYQIYNIISELIVFSPENSKEYLGCV